jgi:hypothetical protein
MIYLGMKLLEWCINPNGIGNNDTVKYPYPSGNKKCEILIKNTRTIFWEKDAWYQCNTGSYLANHKDPPKKCGLAGCVLDWCHLNLLRFSGKWYPNTTHPIALFSRHSAVSSLFSTKASLLGSTTSLYRNWCTLHINLQSKRECKQTRSSDS